MKNNQYCFSIRCALSGTKLIGGTQTATSMEDAARKVIASQKIVHQQDQEGLHVRHRHMYKGKEVYVYVNAHPEYL